MFWVKKATAATVALFVLFGLGLGVGVSVREAPRAGASADPTEPTPANLGDELAALKDQLRAAEGQAQSAWQGVSLSREEVAISNKVGDPRTLASDLTTARLFEEKALEAEGWCMILSARIASLEGLQQEAKSTGPALVVKIGANGAWWPCWVTEYGPSGKPLGTLICDNTDVLRVTLTRAAKDPAAPKELRITIHDGATAERVKAVLDACKAAGFTRVKLTGSLPPGCGKPAGSVGEPRFDAAEFDLDRLISQMELNLSKC
jgi:hypothetical protein